MGKYRKFWLCGGVEIVMIFSSHTYCIKLCSPLSLAEYVAKTTNKDSVLLMKNEYTIKSALDFLESWIKISDYPYRHEETNIGQSKHSYVIQHDMGMKVSTYLASLYQFLFDELGQNKRIEFDKTENTLAFTIASD